MEKNKKYATKCSMLIAMLVLSSLTATIAAASMSVLSLKGDPQPICQYFKVIPSSKDFDIWRKGVKDVVKNYDLKEDLKDWLEDIGKIKVLIKPFDKKENKKMFFKKLIAINQAEEPSILSILFSSTSNSQADNSTKLFNIGKLSSAKFISTDPVIAVLDELYRESMRNHSKFGIPKAREQLKLCTTREWKAKSV